MRKSGETGQFYDRISEDFGCEAEGKFSWEPDFLGAGTRNALDALGRENGNEYCSRRAGSRNGIA